MFLERSNGQQQAIVLQVSYFLCSQEDNLQKMISAAGIMEKDYGHMFDLTVINDDLQEVYEMLIAALTRLENERQWVPVSWLQRH